MDDISPKTNDIRTGTNFYMSATRQLAVDEIDFWGELSKFEIGPHSDIYSLGIMLLEVLAQNFDKAGERSFKKLLNACCQVAEEGESYDQLSSRNMHERFMKKKSYNADYLKARKKCMKNFNKKLRVKLLQVVKSK